MKKSNLMSVIEALEHQNLLAYGSVINRDDLLRMAGIAPLSDDEAVRLNLSVSQIIERSKADDLAELGVADFIRRQLLKRGKYFERNGNQYRVALPSENVRMADNYMKSAQRKIRRAQTLLNNTPPEAVADANRLASRLLLTGQQTARHDARRALQ